MKLTKTTVGCYSQFNNNVITAIQIINIFSNGKQCYEIKICSTIDAFDMIQLLIYASNKHRKWNRQR